MSCNFEKNNIILASGSPRRRKLLRAIIPDFVIAPARYVDESYPDDLLPDKVAAYVSSIKAKAYDDLAENGNIIITADTIVELDGNIYGKPHDALEAFEMLSTLSGRTHHVYTGVTLHSAILTDTFTECTDVTFCKLDPEDIRKYVAEQRPFDKAGSYGIQEWIGYIGVSGINGCYYNVMGLPLAALHQHLKNFFPLKKE